MQVAEGVFQFRVPMLAGRIRASGRERFTLVYAGDHVLPVTTPKVSRFPSDRGNPLQDFIDGQLSANG